MTTIDNNEMAQGHEKHTHDRSFVQFQRQRLTILYLARNSRVGHPGQDVTIRRIHQPPTTLGGMWDKNSIFGARRTL